MLAQGAASYRPEQLEGSQCLIPFLSCDHQPDYTEHMTDSSFALPIISMSYSVAEAHWTSVCVVSRGSQSNEFWHILKQSFLTCFGGDLFLLEHLHSILSFSVLQRQMLILKNTQKVRALQQP